jgi:hypothetical protein
VPLERLRRPEEGPARGEAGVAELIGDAGVDVGHEGHTEQPRHRRDQVGRLLHRVDHVEPAGGHEERGLEDERNVEEELGRRWTRLHPAHREAWAPPVHQTGNVDGVALGIGEELHTMAGRGEGPDHGEDGEGRSPDLEEGLGREEEDPEGARRPPGVARSQWLRNRSASMADMQPVPAAVTA